MNVCHLASGDLWAGAEVQMYILVKALSTEPSVNISAIVLNPGKLAEQLKSIGIDVSVFDESKHGFFQLRHLITEKLRAKNIDILHSHRYKENILAGMVKNRCAIKKLVQTVHGAAEPFGGVKRIKSGFINALNIYYSKKYFDRLIAVSNDLASQLTDIYPAEKITAVHNSVDFSAVHCPENRNKIKLELGLSENDIIIGTAGRLVPIKAYDIFIEMAVNIRKTQKNAKFLLVGDGPLRNDLEKKTEELNISDSVKLLGFRDDIADIMNCMDIFVVSSHHEGIPMVVLEAMAMGKPVVSTKVGGLVEIIEHNKSGLLVDAVNANALADACLAILNDSNLKVSLSSGARNRIEEEFSSDIQKKRILEVYSEVLRSK